MSGSASKHRRRSLLPFALPSSSPSSACYRLGEAIGVRIWETHTVYQRKRVGNAAVLLSGCVSTYGSAMSSMAHYINRIGGDVFSHKGLLADVCARSLVDSGSSWDRSCRVPCGQAPPAACRRPRCLHLFGGQHQDPRKHSQSYLRRRRKYVRLPNAKSLEGYKIEPKSARGVWGRAPGGKAILDPGDGALKGLARTTCFTLRA